ncbi:MAG: protein-L-isoaspartate(D-aspartate) O-methyltransferase [Bryobacteraceae bacterium]|nr:protein-L-isoaspartate(D-aspartate) O-methyltransferase [Bryobacteraceae bacterium]
MTAVLNALLASAVWSADLWEEARAAMVAEQIEARGVRDARVLRAMRKIPRHQFVPPEMAPHAYQDRPLPIGHGQTISQPYIVAFMSEILEIRPEHQVLEIGAGSGYQAAVLSLLARQVYTIEVVPALARSSRALLQRLGYANVTVREGDGYQGWPEQAPFDRIILTAAPPEIPQPLIDQLKPGGRLVAPVGRGDQDLIVLDKLADGSIRRKAVLPVRFVPMVPGREKR